MFDDLYDATSTMWSWRWATSEGEVTAVDLERIRHANSGNDTLRLAIAYNFSLDDDGLYTGESFWQPSFCVKRMVFAARHKARVRQRVTVCCRRDDPSVNMLGRRVGRDF